MLKFCRQIDILNRIFYDPVRNLFLVNGITALKVTPRIEYKMLEAIEQAEIAGLSQSEILDIVSGILWDSYPEMYEV